MLKKFWGCALALAIASHGAFARELNVPAETRPQIRGRIKSCETLLAPSDQIDDSVGIPFGGNSPEDFERELAAGVSQYGLEKFRGGTFYVLGHAMSEEAVTQNRFDEILRVHALTQVGAKVKVLTVPSNVVRAKSISTARGILERARYFFPSLKRDLQAPQWGEMITNWQATMLIESATVFFVYKAMPATEATLVLVTHAALLNAYSIFSKSMLNYLLREGGSGKVGNAVELFLKQMLLSLPFVVNFNVFGRLSEILSYYKTWGWEQTLAHFPYELAHFSTTQGVTLALQTVFYSAIITRGFGGWVDSQIGDENSRDARTLRPLMQIPVLATDSVLMMLASSDIYGTLLSLNGFDINVGHVGLAALTGATWLFFKKFPKALNGVLRKYQERRQRRSQQKL